MKKLALGLALTALATVSATALADGYDIDPVHSFVGFTIKHMMVSSVHGKFDSFTGTIEVDDKTPTNDKVNVEIDATSVDTGNEKRDGHLKSADFFDATKFPKITFASTSVKSLGGGKLEATGDLTMHGVTKSVVLAVSDLTADFLSPMDKLKHRGAHATVSINRQDFGIKWNAPVSSKAGEMALSDNVDITIDLEVIQKKK